MDQNSIIDRKTFEVCKYAEDYQDVFICDKPIADAVALLNKKGYKTIASCSGHYQVAFYEYYDEDLSLLEKFRNDDKVIIKKIKDNSFDYWTEIDSTHTYILFDKNYKFQTLPEGFEKNIDVYNSRVSIEKKISYYDENNERKKRYDVCTQIDEIGYKLKIWAESLPVNERK